MDPVTATASDLADALRRRDISSREALEALLARIDAVNPAINAVVALDADRALARADDADAATARGESWGLLHGVSMTVKDVWETEGLVTTSGAPELRGHVPTADAVTVARLKAAGAIVFGKTNTPLYAGDLQTYNEVYGVTSNPWDVTRTTGGSSGGSAAAVAAGLTPLELGSDIGGSIRAPSHFCGTYGLKPSWGILPVRGHIPGPPGSLIETDVNCGGPIARSVADLGLALDVLAGPLAEESVAWRLDLPSPSTAAAAAESAIAGAGRLGGVRVAVVFDDADFPVAGEVRDVLRSFVDRLADAGARVDEVVLPVSLGDGYRSWLRLALPTIGKDFPDAEYDLFAEFASVDADDLYSVSAASLAGSYRAWSRADQSRQEQRRRWAAFFADHDVVLAPVMPIAAFAHDHEATLAERTVSIDDRTVGHLDLTVWCGAIGVMLLPVAAVPAGRTPSGLPVGVQVIGPYLQDRSVLALAAAFDRLGGGFVAPPAW